ncbi:MAG TPA: hypothetical protein VIF62_20960 [Labilithrix sp.]|jgi:hypothetical protein
MSQPKPPYEPEQEPQIPRPVPEPGQDPNAPTPEIPGRKEYPIHREIPEQPIHEER